jgi:hypothetical protein
MESNPSANDPKTIWQKQPGETPKVTMILIRQRARALHAKTRRDLIGSAIVHVFAFVYCVAGAALSHSFYQRIAYGAGVAYVLAGVVAMQRGKWTAPMGGDAGLESGIRFCRKEVERQSAIFSRGLMWVAGPLIFVIGVYLVPAVVATVYANKNANPKVLVNAIPFFVLMGIWVVSMFFIRMRQRRGLQREFEDLDAIEKENR